MTLRELNIGDYFYAKSDKKRREKFHVLGKPEFNSGFGSATRKCTNMLLQKLQNKSCRLEVIKVENDYLKSKRFLKLKEEYLKNDDKF